MISLEPSKILLMRRSRRSCSAGTARSPRASRESAVSKPRPPRICTSSSAILQLNSVDHSLASAASMRTSFWPASAISAESSNTASSAKVVAAMKAIFLPTASCLPTGRPHCVRALDHSREIFRLHFPAATQRPGMESRPVLRVVRAILSPWPSRPSRFAAGTRTWWKRVTPFSMPRRPMKAFRFSTVMPGESISTTKAEMPPLCSVPSGSVWAGTLAMTTTSSAITPLVVQSFTPSRR
ncbi:hypothetical protein PJL18_02792 [Paenarthrobacter nicotinovorans]|nr:hypothetical protein [Paenarthrobacter nicotinovorans]